MIEAGRLVKYAGATVPPVQLGQAVVELATELVVEAELVLTAPHVVLEVLEVLEVELVGVLLLELELLELEEYPTADTGVELELELLLEELEELDLPSPQVLLELEELEELLVLDEDRELLVDVVPQDEVSARATAARPETMIAENFIFDCLVSS